MDNLMKARRKQPTPEIPPPPETVTMRLRSLPSAQQWYITDKYYSGKMPWRED